MLYWLMVGIEVGITEEVEEVVVEHDETPEDGAWLPVGMREGAWGLVGELIGM